jgi:uncharacterized protein (DUF736 family)
MRLHRWLACSNGEALHGASFCKVTRPWTEVQKNQLDFVSVRIDDGGSRNLYARMFQRMKVGIC